MLDEHVSHCNGGGKYSVVDGTYKRYLQSSMGNSSHPSGIVALFWMGLHAGGAPFPWVLLLSLPASMGLAASAESNPPDFPVSDRLVHPATAETTVADTSAIRASATARDNMSQQSVEGVTVRRGRRQCLHTGRLEIALTVQ